MKEKKAIVIPNPNVLGDKMRIRLVDPKSGYLISDRLIDQAIEMKKGPTDVHKGPIGLEFNLNSQESVDEMIDYIRKLKGELPLIKPDKKSPQNKTLEKMLKEKDALGDLLKQVKAKAKTQEDLIKILREYNFMFVDQGTAQDLPSKEMLTLREKDIERDYQYMVRRIKEAKDPANDKYDWRLVFAIKIIGERIDLVQVYLWGQHAEFMKLPWADKKKVNFKKVEKIYSFPEMMDYAERKKWRMENRKVIKAEEAGVKFDASKFYRKWKPYIKVDGKTVE